MKELTIEEKAKRYEEALNAIKNLISAGLVYEDAAVQIFPELKESKESEDERIRKGLIGYFLAGKCESISSYHGVSTDDILAWLEKQGEHANFRNNIQIGDKVTRNEDGVLINLSQLKRVAKKDEKQGEQKPDNKVEPKFHEGDWLVHNERKNIVKVVNATPLVYKVVDVLGYHHTITDTAIENNYHLWTIKDAKDGDVLFQDLMGGKTFIYNGVNPNMAILYSFIISNDGEDVLPYHIGQPNTGIGNIEENKNIIYPATKEQRDFLFKKMKEAGYKWNFEKKKFHEGDWLVNIKYGNVVRVLEVLENNYRLDYDVDTIGTLCTELVDNDYRLWTIQDAKDGDMLFTSSTASHETFIFKNIDEKGNVKCYFAYDSEDGFREGKYHFIGSATNCKPATKEQYDALMKAMADAGWEFDIEKKELKKIVDEEQIKKNLQDNSFRRMFEQKTTEWSEEDERMYRGLHNLIYSTQYCDSRKEFSDWLKFIKDRVQPQPQQEWSEEDERNASYICAALDCYHRLREERNNTNGQENLDKARNWLYNRFKSLRPQNNWRPSDEQLKSLKEVIDAGHFTSYPYALETLYEKLNSLYSI